MSWTGWATAWLGNKSRPPSVANQPHAVAAQYIADAMHEQAPRFFDDDVENGRHVVTATIALADALMTQRQRFSRAKDDDTRAFLHSLVTFVLANEGGTIMASRHQYNMLVDAWNAVPRVQRPVVEIVEAETEDDVDVQAEWRFLISERLGHIPGVCMTGSARRSMSSVLFDAWTQTSTAESVEQLFDIVYTVDEESGAVHRLAAEQGLKPLVAAVEHMRTLVDPASVRLDWILCVEHLEDKRVHCSVAYRVYTTSEIKVEKD